MKKIDYPEQIIDEPIRRFDIMTFREEKQNFLTALVKTDLDIHQRRLISLIAFLPTYMRMGMFRYKMESKTMDSFLEEFIIQLETLVSFDISLKEDTRRFRWDSDRQQAMTSLVLKYTTYLFQKLSEYKLEEIVFRIYLTIILFQKYPVTPEDTLSIIADPLNEISDELFSRQKLASDSIFGEKYLYNGMSNLIKNGPPKTKHYGYFQLITLYHCLFPSQDKHSDNLRGLNYSTSEYWGFPEQSKFIIKHPISDKDIKNAFKLVCYDPILPYNILYCCPLSKLDIFYQIYNSNPRYLPLQAILAF